MQIDGTRADGATARQRNLGLPHTGDERAQHPEAGAHARDHFVGRGRVHDIAGGEVEGFAQMGGAWALAVHGQINAMVAQDADQKVHVRQIGHVF